MTRLAKRHRLPLAKLRRGIPQDTLKPPINLGGFFVERVHLKRWQRDGAYMTASPRLSLC